MHPGPHITEGLRAIKPPTWYFPCSGFRLVCSLIEGQLNSLESPVPSRPPPQI